MKKSISLIDAVCILLRAYLAKLERERLENAPHKTTSAWSDY
jgi:hypothetical protein